MVRPLLAGPKSQGYAWLDCKPDELVIDVGCGLGLDVAELVKTGADVRGLEPNGILLAQAEKDYGNIAKFEQRSAEVTGLEAGTVDKLRYDRVLQHIGDHGPVFAEAKRILKPGGVIQIIDTDWLSLSYFLPDLALERRLVDMIAGRIKGSRALRYVPARLKQLGFGHVRVAVHQLLVNGFDQLEYILSVDEILRDNAGGYGFTESDIAAWQEWKQSGECYLAVNVVTMQAVKSENP
jgi:SAM-dependent methyltransferase